MNILLVNPPCRIPALVPLGLGYIASVLRNEGHRVHLMDLNAHGRLLSDIEADLGAPDYDLVGIGGLTTTYNFVKSFAAMVKRNKPEVKIMAGNMVSTAHPVLLLKNSEIDICVIDEGEETVKELAHKIAGALPIDNVNGIIFKDNGQIRTTPPRKRIIDLDSLPYPSWDLFPMEVYINNPIHLEYGRRSMNVSSVRGCPFQCIYCSRPFGSHVYMRSPDSVVKEMKELKKRYKIEYVGFSDDLFMVNRKWVEDVCDKLINTNMHIGWGASARVNLVDAELLKKMRKAGCEMLSYGFESGSQKVLDRMKKGVKVEQAECAIEMTRKAGIKVNGSFMIGMIGETEDTINETVDFIKRTGLAMHRFFYTTPYPGTPLYDIAKKMNRIPADEDAYVGSLAEMHDTFLVNLTDMPDDRLKDLKAKAEKKIKDNFNFGTKMEILSEDSARIFAGMKKRFRQDGISPTASWLFEKAIKKLGL